MRRIGGKAAVLLAVVLGLAAAYLVFSFLNHAQQQAQAAAKPVPTVAVLTAAQNIPSRTAITPAMVRLLQVPATVKLPSALTDPSAAVGKVAKTPMSTGEQVLTDKLFATRNDSGLSFIVPPGKRAVAVGVSEQLGSGGLIVPGDRVDVLVLFDLTATASASPSASPSPSPPASGSPATSPQGPSAAAEYVLQNIEVLAVAQQLEGDIPAQSSTQKVAGTVAPNQNQQAQAQPVNPNPAARTVTLAVNPDEAERLILAEDKGHLRLVVRAHGDAATFQTQTNTFGNVHGAATFSTDPRSL